MSNSIQQVPGQFQMTRPGSRGDEESGPRPDHGSGRAARAAASAGKFFSGLAEGSSALVGQGSTAAWNGIKYGGNAAWGSTKTVGSATWSGVKTGGNLALTGAKVAGNAGLKGAKSAGTTGWNDTKSSAVALGKFTLAPLQNKAWGALGGHALQQMITCGLPTMMREEAFIEAYNMLLPHLAEKHPAAAVGLQAAVSLANIAAHIHVREPRLARDPQHNQVAVRGQFGLSPDRAEVMRRDKPAEWNRLSAQTQTDSKRVTGQQIAAELLNVGMSLAGALTGNPGLTARVLSTQLRNVIYAGTRESLQATGSMVASRDGKASYGVSDDNMSTNGAWYTLNTLAMGMLQDGLIQKALPKGYTVSGPEIRDAAGKPLSGKALHEMGAIVSALRAACNTVIETGDAFLGKHYDAKQVGDGQKLSPSLPMKDYGRLLDHSIARLSWNNFANGSTLASQQIMAAITKGKMSPLLSSLFNNAGTAAAFGLTYKVVNQIYQAHSKVRGAVAAESQASATTSSQAPLTASAAATNTGNQNAATLTAAPGDQPTPTGALASSGQNPTGNSSAVATGGGGSSATAQQRITGGSDS
ncbi:hypothetical protein SD961_02075 [Erwinia sp. MMLR14_017]|uniref:hypothetical protein n=1 Tax=Erwinia sp. MMLR14_017 TaxID=3093842 RepID=UPI0029904357|nr:hypothetical protein [Erwinia sp. MMLR14_017]MDW8844685.1 hypothetical protein [Erwinia sp. MMLR14_017]